MTQLVLHGTNPASPLATHDMALAEQLANELFGTNLRELFPIAAFPVLWEPDAALLAIEALLEQAQASPAPAFPGLFGAEPMPQDIHNMQESEIPLEDLPRIKWRQQYTKGEVPWLRFSFESPLPTGESSEAPPDTRLEQLQKELTALQTFLQTVQANPGAALAVGPTATPAPAPTTSEPAPATSAPVSEPATPAPAPAPGAVSAPSPAQESAPPTTPAQSATEPAASPDQTPAS